MLLFACQVQKFIKIDLSFMIRTVAKNGKILHSLITWWCWVGKGGGKFLANLSYHEKGVKRRCNKR